MDKTTPSGSNKGDPVTRSRFEASPDPLLQRTSDPHAVNLYAPGALDRSRGPARILDPAQDRTGQRSPSAQKPGWDHPARARFDERRQVDAPVEFEARMDSGHGSGPGANGSGGGGPIKSRMLALLLAVLFGHLGAHDFYLGMTNLGFRFLALTFVCIFMTSATGVVFFLLPIMALLVVEMVQIAGGTGRYAGVNFHHRL